MPTTAPEKFLDIFYYYHFKIFVIFKFFITLLIFIFITYYYLAKKDPIFKIYIFYNFCDFVLFF